MSVTITQPAEKVPTVEYNSAAELAEKMLEILNQRGWCRGDVEDGDGRVCLVGALGVAYGLRPVGGYELHATTQPALGGLIDGVSAFVANNEATFPGALSANHFPTLWRFNDVYADGVEDVKAVLRYVIDRESREPAGV